MMDCKRIHAIVVDSLYRDDEIIDGVPIVDPVKVDGIVSSIGFHPERVKSHTDEIDEMLGQLPRKFWFECGGGGSFLEMCTMEDGGQWGEQYNAEELMVLGIAIGRISYCLPRKFWNVFPGGVPYIQITKGVKCDDELPKLKPEGGGGPPA